MSDKSNKTDTAQQKEQQMDEHQDSSSGSAGSEFASEPADESSHPEFRAHTIRKKDNIAAKFTPIFKVGKGVYEKGARALNGPYTIAKVNSDGTYQLNDEFGRPFKDKVQERNLKPV